jgi:hypothetical protein
MTNSLTEYEDWISFYFDRPVTEDIEKRFCLFVLDNDSIFESKPDKIVENMTRLFKDFKTFGAKYSLQEINQGIWAILSGDGNHCDCLFSRKVDIQTKMNCILSMYFVFSEFVSNSQVEVMENCFYMWWDFIANGFWNNLGRNNYSELENFIALDEVQKIHKNRNEYNLKDLDEESWMIFNAIYETLIKILQLDDIRTQSYALHGLGHLHHPKVKETIRNYINLNKNKLDEPAIRWLNECCDGEVM